MKTVLYQGGIKDKILDTMSLIVVIRLTKQLILGDLAAVIETKENAV